MEAPKHFTKRELLVLYDAINCYKERVDDEMAMHNEQREKLQKLSDDLIADLWKDVRNISEKEVAMQEIGEQLEGYTGEEIARGVGVTFFKDDIKHVAFTDTFEGDITSNELEKYLYETAVPSDE